MINWIKLAVVAAAVAALAYGVHRYNEYHVDKGRAEVAADWSRATMEQKEAFDAARRRLEGEKLTLSKKYQAEQKARLEAEKAADEERENAIRSSVVAGNICFDDRMRDNWNRDSGHAGAGAP